MMTTWKKHMRIKKRLGKIRQHSTKYRPMVTASADAGSIARCHCPSVRKAKINDSARTQQRAPWHVFQNKYSWSNKSLSEGNQHTESLEIWNQVLKQLISTWKEKQRTHPGSIVIRHLRNQAAWQNSSDDCSVLNMLRLKTILRACFPKASFGWLQQVSKCTNNCKVPRLLLRSGNTAWSSSTSELLSTEAPEKYRKQKEARLHGHYVGPSQASWMTNHQNKFHSRGCVVQFARGVWGQD